MAYQSLGLAGLIVAALRHAVADPALADEISSQAAGLNAVRSTLDTMGAQLTTLQTKIAADEALSADDHEALAGIQAELSGLATALAGPADDDTDNGALSQVQPVDNAPPSPSADAAAGAPAEAPAKAEAPADAPAEEADDAATGDGEEGEDA